MKLMLAAIALTIASPALAQTAPANPHADHAAQTMQAAPVEHSEHGTTSSADPHAGHEMAGGCCEQGADGKMACCDMMKAEGNEMACCEEAPAEPPAADPHAGHDMSQH